MRKILIFIDSKEWRNIDDFTTYRRNYAFVLHFYFGSPVSSNVVLQYRNFNSLEEFMEHIILQIPVKRRNNKALKNLFKKFYPEYFKTSEINSVIKKKSSDFNDKQLSIKFDEYGVNLKSDTAQLKRSMKRSVDLRNIVENFINNAEAFKEDRTQAIKVTANLLEKIKNSGLDVFRNRQAKIDKVFGTPVENNILKVDINPSTGAPFTVNLPVKRYESAKEFLDAIIIQIPPGRGDLKSFSTYLDQLFQPDSNRTNNAPTSECKTNYCAL